MGLESSPCSRVFAAIVSDLRPCWPCGIQVVSSISDGRHYEGLVKTKPRNACIFSFGFSSPLASSLLGPILLLREGEKENSEKKNQRRKFFHTGFQEEY